MENYTIESPASPASNSPILAPAPLKRCLQVPGPITYNKRLKLNKQPSTENRINKINEAVLEDTLDSYNLSGIFPQNASKSNNEPEFDAFAGNSNNEVCNLKMASSDDDLFSQSLNTQMINELDVAIAHEESKSFDESDEELSKSIKEDECSKNINDCFKIPQTKGKKVIKNHDRSLLFNDELVTSIYKQDVDLLFEQIEQSICAMGTAENREKTLPDKMLDVFFADDLAKRANMDIDDAKIQEELSRSLHHRRDESFLNDCSFGTIVKQALLNNASKTIEKQNISINTTLNRSVPSNACLECKKLGSFYDLPDRVKELIKQYKGIDKLYGEK